MKIVETPTVTLLQTECRLGFGHYENGTVAMQAETLEGEPFLTLTVNYEANWEGYTPYAEFFKPPVVVLKNYRENAGIIAQLQAAGVINRGGAYLSGSDGKVEVRGLTPLWLAHYQATRH